MEFMQEEFLEDAQSVQALDLILVSVGPYEVSIEVDPYFDAVNWGVVAACDGRSYGGIRETVIRHPGESWDAFYARARARADELNEELP